LKTSCKGFTLIEVLTALAVTATVSAMVFQLFHQNERVIRDQSLITEMQQTARIVASQIADEVRMAGQGVPIYPTRLDTVPTEATAIILSSSTATRIDFRAGLSNIETTQLANDSRDFVIGVSRNISIPSTPGFTIGKFIYVSGPGASHAWPWIRAEVKAATTTLLTVTPRNTGTSDTAVHFTAPSTISLEEIVSIYLSSGTVRRATATDMTNPTPTWSPANELGKNFTTLSFVYYDAAGNPIQPTSLSNRMAIACVEVRLTVEVERPLSNGTRPTFSLAVTTFPRNPRVRDSN